MSKPITTTGLLFKSFYVDESVWGSVNADWYVEDLCFSANGEGALDALYELYGDTFSGLPDDAVVVVENGDIMWQGHGKEPVRADGGDMVKAFQLWLNVRTRINLVATFDLPKDIDIGRLQSIVGILAELGAKIQGGPELPPTPPETFAKIQAATSILLAAPAVSGPPRARGPAA